MKSLQLLSVLPRRPSEFMERIRMIAQSRWESAVRRRPAYALLSFEDTLAQLRLQGLREITSFVNEPALLEIETQVQRNILQLPAEAPFASFHHGDPLLAQICFAVARVLRPNLAVETGVCYGVTSAYLLRAIRENHKGNLHSIDLPPLGKGGDDYVGRLIPPDLREKWTLHRGSSGKLLKPLLKKIGPIDLFVHDSMHTYRNMAREFALAWSALRPGGILISDDVEGNSAFLELTRFRDVAFSAVIN
ncbi:MAG: class I SAM-dependent methyltransferase, partial [Candidatus Acidiferrum sp.]